MKKPFFRKRRRLTTKLDRLEESGRISSAAVSFGDDGSQDNTWALIAALHKRDLA
jgi:hypothetical protein